MPALTSAQDAYEAARSALQDAVQVEAAAAAAAAAIRQQIADGAGAKIKPSDITAADAKAEHAKALAVGAQRAMAGLHEAAMAARVDATCDSIVGNIPVLGSRVRSSLEVLIDALGPFVESAQSYDRFIDESIRQVSISHHDLSTRVMVGRFSAPTVDQKPLESCRGASQLAKAILPAMVALGVPSGHVDALRQMADGAPTLPTAV